MDWSLAAEHEAFRAEVRAWLEAHLEPRFVGLGFRLDVDPEWLGLMREWNARVADAGYAAIAWPTEFGGRDAGLVEQMVLAEELDRAQAPPTLNPLGIANIAPAILQFGTDEQKRRLLPPMRRGDEIWCQGFSEPDAGSDLAALTTSAVRDNDEWVINGQKVWSTLGTVADWCELLVRTDPAAPRHGGISCLLIDMRTPGIEVRPLTTITGEVEFAELFFTDVRVPYDALLGEENQGWNVAMTTLMNERAGVANLHLGVRRRIRRLIADAVPVGDTARRRRLASLYLHGEELKLLADRAVSGSLHGRPFGPESSLAKLVWSDVEQEAGDVAAEMNGMDALAAPIATDRLRSRSFSIAGGTTQVNKNIIATRILGLPRA